MTSEKSEKGQTAEGRARKSNAGKTRVPPALLLAAWFVPGLGHWILGKRTRAIVFGLVIVSAFFTGVLLNGELGTPKPENPFSWLAAFACLGNGVLYLGRLLWLDGLAGVVTGIPFSLDGVGKPGCCRICIRQYLSLHRGSHEFADGVGRVRYFKWREGLRWITSRYCCGMPSSCRCSSPSCGDRRQWADVIFF